MDLGVGPFEDGDHTLYIYIHIYINCVWYRDTVIFVHDHDRWLAGRPEHPLWRWVHGTGAQVVIFQSRMVEVYKHLVIVFTLWLFNIAMENGPFIDGLPIKNGDFPWLC